MRSRSGPSICKALAEGRQAIVLRKGGIAEKSGEFQVEHTRFWLYPTYVHQQRDGVTRGRAAAAGAGGGGTAAAGRRPADALRGSDSGVYHLHNLPAALLLGGMHCLSAATVKSRFEYKHPGLFVLPVRVYRAAQAIDLPETAYYAGCRSWVELERELPTDGATPVLSDEAFREVRERLDRLLHRRRWRDKLVFVALPR